MSETPPLVTASRDTLADGLQAADDSVDRRYCLHVADALLASGVVRTVDGLADDEALVDVVAGQMFAAQAVTDLDDMARVAIRALAAALATPTDPNEAP